MDHYEPNSRLMVFFDLPTTSKEERRIAARFRNDLIKENFYMLQYSVYVRFCHSSDTVEVYKSRIRYFIPPNGNIRMIVITEKQYKDMEVVLGEKSKPEEQACEQLSFL